MEIPFRVNLERFVKVRHIRNEMVPLDDESPADVVLLQHVLDGYSDELRFRLGLDKPYRNKDRHSALRSILNAINPLFDAMAAEIPEGQNRVCDDDLPMFIYLRDVSLDVTGTLMGLEGQNDGINTRLS